MAFINNPAPCHCFQAYEVPCYFSSDWLNAYYDALGEAQNRKADDQGVSASKGTSTADYR